MGFQFMTEVQSRTIPALLTGRDVLGAARTGQDLVSSRKIAARTNESNNFMGAAVKGAAMNILYINFTMQVPEKH